jgi:hypothetical protein
VLAAGSRPAAAVGAIEKAVELYERKGNVISASVARRRLTGLAT